MGELTKRDQVAFWSAPEVRMALDALLSESRHVHGVDFRGGVLKQQHLLNGLILYVAALPKPERARVVAEGVELLERALADDAGAGDGAGPAAPEAGTVYPAKVRRVSDRERRKGAG